MEDDENQMFYIEYTCPYCEDSQWADYWSCLVDGVCPDCGTKNISPVNWQDVTPEINDNIEDEKY